QPLALPRGSSLPRLQGERRGGDGRLCLRKSAYPCQGAGMGTMWHEAGCRQLRSVVPLGLERGEKGLFQRLQRGYGRPVVFLDTPSAFTAITIVPRIILF